MAFELIKISSGHAKTRSTIVYWNSDMESHMLIACTGFTHSQKRLKLESHPYNVL